MSTSVVSNKIHEEVLVTADEPKRYKFKGKSGGESTEQNNENERKNSIGNELDAPPQERALSIQER
jgi:hypothetical protein